MSEVQFFKNYPGIIARMSVRSDGDMRTKRSGEKFDNPNYSLFLHRHLIPKKNVINPVLEHGNRIVIVTADTGSDIYGDALITRIKEKFLAINVANWFPVFLFDPRNGIIGLVDGDWLPLTGGILLKTVIRMVNLGAKLGDIMVAVGPGICQKCLEFSDKEIWKLEKYCQPEYLSVSKKEKTKVSLTKIINTQLNEVGVRNIIFHWDCTHCQKDKYFSKLRGDKGQMLAVIGMAG